MNFGNKIFRLRKEKGLTQSQLAEMLNISNKTISRWETNEGYPEITLLKPLAAALGTTVDDLLSDDENEENGAEQGPGRGPGKTRIYYEAGEKVWKHEEINADLESLKKLRLKKFWQSLTIFNKIAVACIVISLGIIPVSAVASFLLPYGIGTLFTMIPQVFNYVGFIAAIIGVVTSLFDISTRQLKPSVILAILNFVLRYVITFICFGFTILTF